MAQTIAAKYFGAYEKRNIFLSSGVVAVAYVSLSLIAAHYLPGAAGLEPTIAIALSALFLGGLRLTPAVGLAAVASALLIGEDILTSTTLALSATLISASGAYLLRWLEVDPIFRRKRDVFRLITALSAVSLITPLLPTISGLMGGTIPSLSLLCTLYLGTLSSLLVVTPFVLRWLAKPRFRRSYLESLEALTALGFFSVLSYALFVAEIPAILGVPILYLLFIPLLWIALRLRPRFVTLALMVLAGFVLYNAAQRVAETVALTALVNAEMYLILLSIIALIITSQEEERRVSTTIMLSQLGSLENAVAQLHSDSKSKEGFIAVLAHELRNPLAPVVSTIELLQLKGPRDEEEAEALSVISDRMQAMRKLLEDLLDVSHLLEGKIKLDLEHIDMQKVLRASILSTDHYREEMHQELSTTMPERPLWIMGDKVRIEQVFTNLLSNASKYSHSGDTIHLSVSESEGMIQVEVADHGIGLKPETLESIFKPFHQAYHGEKAIRGLGIGLALVKNFVSLHGGTVRAMSEGAGHGSRFMVRLPSTPPPAERVPDPSRLQRIMREGTSSGPLILVVDDNDAAAAALGRLLERLQYRVIYAYDGAQALESALDRDPTTILLDIQLPKLNGREVASALKERGYRGTIVALSGYGENDTVAMHGKTDVFDHYLVKPVGLGDLRNVLPRV